MSDTYSVGRPRKGTGVKLERCARINSMLDVKTYRFVEEMAIVKNAPISETIFILLREMAYESRTNSAMAIAPRG